MALDNKYGVQGKFYKPLPNPLVGLSTGRYYYRQQSSATTTIQVIDLSLITSGNYAGAGAWTSSPFSNITGMSSRGGASLIVNTRQMKLFRGQAGGSETYVIDINPYSGSFHTASLLSGGMSGATAQESGAYVHSHDIMFVLQGTKLYAWKYPENKMLGYMDVPNVTNTYMFYDCSTEILYVSGTNGFHVFKILKPYNGEPIIRSAGGRNTFTAYGTIGDYLIASTGGAIQTILSPDVSNPDLFYQSHFSKILASVSQTHQPVGRGGMIHKKSKTLYVSNGLTTYSYDASNPLAITSKTSDTRTAIGSETTTVFSDVNELYNILLVFGNSATAPVHFYDISNGGLTYIGYYTYGVAHATAYYHTQSSNI